MPRRLFPFRNLRPLRLPRLVSTATVASSLGDRVVVTYAARIPAGATLTLDALVTPAPEEGARPPGGAVLEFENPATPTLDEEQDRGFLRMVPDGRALPLRGGRDHRAGAALHLRRTFLGPQARRPPAGSGADGGLASPSRPETRAARAEGGQAGAHPRVAGDVLDRARGRSRARRGARRLARFAPAAQDRLRRRPRRPRSRRARSCASRSRGSRPPRRTSATTRAASTPSSRTP